jgi:hypothetical protein
MDPLQVPSDHEENSNQYHKVRVWHTVRMVIRLPHILGLPKLLLSAAFRIQYPAFRVHFTGDDGHCPFCIDKVQRIHTFIPIASLGHSCSHTSMC